NLVIGAGAKQGESATHVGFAPIPTIASRHGPLGTPPLRLVARQPPRSLLRMLPPLAQNTSTTPISEPPATTPDATGKVNSSASFGFRLMSSSAIRAPRKNKSP